MPLQVHYQQPQHQQQQQQLQLHHPFKASGVTSSGLSHFVTSVWNLQTLLQDLPQSCPFDNPLPVLQLQEDPFPILSFGWQKVLNLKTGEISYYSRGKEERSVEETAMSRRNGNAPKLDLKLNLSPPRGNLQVQSPSRSSTVSPTSPPSSCLSSELNQEDTYLFSDSPDSTAMIVAGCPRCLMYIMLPEKDPRCPRCKSTVLLEVFSECNKKGGDATNTTSTARTQRK